MNTSGVIVVDYRPQWAQQFEHERTRLMATLADRVIDIVHVGSTAVPGLAAKPVIDMMAGVGSLETFDAANSAAQMAQLGYLYHPEHEDTMPERRYFTAGHDNPEHPVGRWFQLHLVEQVSDFWTRHLIFRDYLRTHPAERDAYGLFKKQLAPAHTSTFAYSEAKSEFIARLESRALYWAQHQAGEQGDAL
ncbi:MAG: GrpB family protein [Chloroflexota bacterium]